MRNKRKVYTDIHVQLSDQIDVTMMMLTFMSNYDAIQVSNSNSVRCRTPKIEN